MKLAEITNAKKEKKQIRALKNLTEEIILQSLSDLWVPRESEDCIKFFRGEGFKICADIAGINLHDQAKLLALANRTIAQQAAIRDRQKSSINRKVINSLKKLSPRNVKLSSVAKADTLQGVCSI
jgi:hypothetical protein